MALPAIIASEEYLRMAFLQRVFPVHLFLRLELSAAAGVSWLA
jgi:hypothetical protein